MKLPQFPTHSACTACSLHSSVKSVGISTRWADWSLPPSPSTPAVLFIGQNPGYDEEKQGINFVGPTGRLARYVYIGCILDDHRHPDHGQPIGTRIFNRATVYLANTARCATWGEAKPTRSNYRTCSHYLTPDIHSILPTCSRLLVVLMGEPAIEAFYRLYTGKSYSASEAFNHSGELVSLPPLHIPNFTSEVLPSTPTVQVFSTYHPAYVLRYNAMLAAVIDHLSLVSDALDGVLATPSSPSVHPPCPYDPSLISLARRSPP